MNPEITPPWCRIPTYVRHRPAGNDRLMRMICWYEQHLPLRQLKKHYSECGVDLDWDRSDEALATRLAAIEAMWFNRADLRLELPRTPRKRNK